MDSLSRDDGCLRKPARQKPQLDSVGGFGEHYLTGGVLEEPSHWLLQSIFDSCDDAIISKDLNGLVRAWNKGAETIFGYSAAETLGRSITLLLPEDRLEEETEFLRVLRRGGNIRGFETFRLHKKGHLIPVSLTISPVRDASGRIVGASKIARDITERKKREQALILSERQAHRIADAAPALISYIGADLRYRFINKQYELWFGRPRT